MQNRQAVDPVDQARDIALARLHFLSWVVGMQALK